jgi:hypothetical protein
VPEGVGYGKAPMTKQQRAAVVAELIKKKKPKLGHMSKKARSKVKVR